MKKALLVEGRKLRGSPAALFVGEALEWPKVDGVEFVTNVNLDEIQERLRNRGFLDRLKNEGTDAIVFMDARVFRDTSAADLIALISAISPDVPSDSVERWPLAAVLTSKSEISGPVHVLRFNFIEPTLVGV